MIGILPGKVRETYRVPDDVQPLTGLAIGCTADPNTLPENLRARDLAPHVRNKLADFVFESTWGEPSTLVR